MRWSESLSNRISPFDSQVTNLFCSVNFKSALRANNHGDHPIGIGRDGPRTLLGRVPAPSTRAVFWRGVLLRVRFCGEPWGPLDAVNCVFNVSIFSSTLLVGTL